MAMLCHVMMKLTTLRHVQTIIVIENEMSFLETILIVLGINE